MRRFILVLVLVLIAIGAFLAYKGILSVRNTPNEVDVTVDKNKLQQETQQAAEEARRAGNKVIDKIERATSHHEERPRETEHDGTRPGEGPHHEPPPGTDKTAANK